MIEGGTNMEITQKDVIDAMDYIDVNGIPNERQSVDYNVVSNKGDKYPPKYLTAVAYHLAHDVDINSVDFAASKARGILEELGFKIEKGKSRDFEWIPFYEALADKLLEYKDKRKELFEIMKQLSKEERLLNYFSFNREDWWPPHLQEIDPFSIFGSFNRGLTDKNRTYLAGIYAETFKVDVEPPTIFSGIPVLNNMKSFYGNPGGILWDLFSDAMSYADTNQLPESFQENFEQSLSAISNGLGSITMGLYWIRPNFFLSLDSRNRDFIPKNYGIMISDKNATGEAYVELLDKVKQIVPEVSIPEISLQAWKGTRGKVMEDDYKGIDDSITVPEQLIEEYTKSDFLADVYLSEQDYETLIGLIKHKKNIILQGAPGVGKTYAAKRLAWSILGKREESKIEMIQFHQNYSYEDFIMGYKPKGDSFELQEGIFVNFCRLAADNPDDTYFLIIDEINRGNMSKIFGELLMLIESDYRGEQVRLPYSGQLFSVPANLYIIGMMNTADRSLAMIDYALRRRFSFFEMEPGFESDGFKAYQASLNSEHFNKVISQIQALNGVIEADSTLGKGFCIGHSYFTGQTNYSDVWMKRVIQYDILPMLREYWFDEEEKVKSWESSFRGIFND